MMSEGSLYDYRGSASPEVTRPIVESDRLGPYADTQGPTISHAVFADQIILGLFDPQAGVNLSSLSVTSSQEIAGRAAGVELADLFVPASDHRWILATAVPPTASLTVSVLDNQIGRNLYGEPVGPGNRTKVSFPLTLDGTTPPDDPPPPDPDAEEIARLEAAIEAIASEISGLQAELATLQEQLRILLEN
jgi:hypothetical protein